MQLLVSVPSYGAILFKIQPKYFEILVYTPENTEIKN
jgi:hypothetical protein